MHMHGPMPPMPPSMPGVAGVAGVGPIPPPMFYPHAMAPGMAMGQMSPMAYPMPVGGVGGVGGMNMAPGVELATPARSSGLQVGNCWGCREGDGVKGCEGRARGGMWPGRLEMWALGQL